MVSPPNNWPYFLWSCIVGRNVTHRAGYSLAAGRKPPGQRHTHFFNLEEACDYLFGAMPAGFTVREVDLRFERGSDELLATLPGLTGFFRLVGKAGLADARERLGTLGPIVLAGAKLAHAPLAGPRPGPERADVRVGTQGPLL